MGKDRLKPCPGFIRGEAAERGCMLNVCYTRKRVLVCPRLVLAPDCHIKHKVTVLQELRTKFCATTQHYMKSSYVHLACAARLQLANTHGQTKQVTATTSWKQLTFPIHSVLMALPR